MADRFGDKTLTQLAAEKKAQDATPPSNDVLVFRTYGGFSWNGVFVMLTGFVLLVLFLAIVADKTAPGGLKVTFLLGGILVVIIGGALVFNRRNNVHVRITPTSIIIDDRHFDRTRAGNPEVIEPEYSEHERRVGASQHPVYRVVFPYDDDFIAIPGTFASRDDAARCHRIISRHLGETPHDDPSVLSPAEHAPPSSPRRPGRV